MYFRGTDGVSAFSTTDGKRIELSSGFPNAADLVFPKVVKGADEGSVGSDPWHGSLTEYTGKLIHAVTEEISNCMVLSVIL
jgi:hypothetical protein